jgi:type II secretory pathway pseudopilin PulG
MRNEKGLALVELLAAISILFIVSTVIYSVFFGFNKNYDQISEKNSLDQTANIALATIKQYHQKYEKYFIRYDDVTKTAFIGETLSTANYPLGNPGIELEMKTGFPDAESFTSATKEIESIQPLKIELHLKNKAGQTYEFETILKRY